MATPKGPIEAPVTTSQSLSTDSSSQSVGSSAKPPEPQQQPRPVSSQTNRRTSETQRPHIKDEKGHESRPQEPPVYKWWLLEGFGLLVSLSSLFSLTAILIAYNGHATSDWKSNVSLNAIVSVLGAISRSSLVLPLANGLSQWKWMRFRTHEEQLLSLQHYDEAARGPWGAIMLLLRPRYASFASLGAIAMAVAVAFEPFTQQAVIYPSREAPIGQAFLPRSTYYNISYGPSSRYLAAANVAMYNNIVGLGTPAAASTITANCPTGNCHWDEYTSLGVCSQCANITSRLIHTYPNIPEEKKTCREHGFTSKCPYMVSTPNGLASVGWEDGYTTAVINMTSQDQSAYLLNGDTYTSMVNITMIGMLSPTDFVSFDCVLYGCAKKYNASVVNGHLTETVVKTYWNQSLPTQKFNPQAHDPSIKANLTTTIPGSDLTSGKDETFNFDYDALSPISTDLYNTFISTESGDEQGNQYALGNIQPDGTFAYDPAQGQTSDQVVAFWENGVTNFPASIAQLAEGLTNYMRLAPSPTDDHQAIGVARGNQPYIHVRWAWLALPFALELITYIFILGTVIAARRSDIPIWKASSLVQWFHDAGNEGRLGETKTAREMERLARLEKVQLLGVPGAVALTHTSTEIEKESEEEEERNLAHRLRRAVEEIPGALVG